MTALDTSKPRFDRFLSTDGTTGGTKEMATAADDYYLLADRDMLLFRLIVHYEDIGAASSTKYGAQTALTNGIILQHIDIDGSTVLEDLTDNMPIKANSHWARYSFDSGIISIGGAVDSYLTRWTLEKAGKPLILLRGQRLQMSIQDSLSGLATHTTMIQGVYA